MINERESREVLMLTFRAARFGETELMKAIKAYIRHRQNAPPQHGKLKLKELMQRDQGATVMEIKSDAVKEFQRIAKKYNVDFAITRRKLTNRHKKRMPRRASRKSLKLRRWKRKQLTVILLLLNIRILAELYNVMELEDILLI